MPYTIFRHHHVCGVVSGALDVRGPEQRRRSCGLTGARSGAAASPPAHRRNRRRGSSVSTRALRLQAMRQPYEGVSMMPVLNASSSWCLPEAVDVGRHSNCPSDRWHDNIAPLLAAGAAPGSNGLMIMLNVGANKHKVNRGEAARRSSPLCKRPCHADSLPEQCPCSFPSKGCVLLARSLSFALCVCELFIGTLQAPSSFLRSATRNLFASLSCLSASHFSFTLLCARAPGWMLTRTAGRRSRGVTRSSSQHNLSSASHCRNSHNAVAAHASKIGPAPTYTLGSTPLDQHKQSNVTPPRPQMRVCRFCNTGLQPARVPPALHVDVADAQRVAPIAEHARGPAVRAAVLWRVHHLQAAAHGASRKHRRREALWVRAATVERQTTAPDG
eukprot:6206512-Pleurochrysis_carterae.AAC.1